MGHAAGLGDNMLEGGKPQRSRIFSKDGAVKRHRWAVLKEEISRSYFHSLLGISCEAPQSAA